MNVRSPVAEANAGPTGERSARGVHPIVFVDQGYGFGGSVVALARLIRHLDPREFPAHVIVRHPDQASYLGGCGVRFASLRLVPMTNPHPRGDGGVLASVNGSLRHIFRQAPYVRAVWRAVRATGARLVHANNCVAANQGAIVGARLAGVPVVVKQHGYEWPSHDVRLLARSVDRFMADSADVARDVASLGVPEDRIVTTWCPIEIAEYPVAADAHREPSRESVREAVRETVRRELGVPSDATVFGIVGTLLEWKGQHVVVDAAVRVLADRPRAMLVVAGGPAADADPDYGPRLRLRAAAHGIADRVVFTGHRSDVPRILSALDVAVHASVQPEPFGMVIGEAMACGLPVVASAAGGPLDQVVDGVTGFLVRPGDVESMAGRIGRLLDDAPLRASMGSAGRERVAAEFSSERHAAMTADVYRAVLRERGLSD